MNCVRHCELCVCVCKSGRKVSKVGIRDARGGEFSSRVAIPVRCRAAWAAKNTFVAVETTACVANEIFRVLTNYLPIRSFSKLQASGNLR